MFLTPGSRARPFAQIRQKQQGFAYSAPGFPPTLAMAPFASTTLATGAITDYSLGGNVSMFQLLTPSSLNTSFTGMTCAAGQLDGEQHFIINASTAGTLTLTNESGAGVAANRFRTSAGADVVLAAASSTKAGQAAIVLYSVSLQRWLAYKWN